MITVGNRTYFDEAPWIVTQQGYAQETQIDVTPWIPSDATKYCLACPVMMAGANVDGYIDISTCIRITPGKNYHNFCIGGRMGAVQAGTMREQSFGGIELPYNGGKFYVQHQGGTISTGVNVTLSLLWYEK